MKTSDTFDDLARSVLAGALAPLITLLRERAHELDVREARVTQREKEAQAFFSELRLLKADMLRADTSTRYTMPDVEESGGISWVDPSSLPARELLLLRALQGEAERRLRESGTSKPRTCRVLTLQGSNSDLLTALSDQLEGVNTSAFSACLSRMGHRDLIRLTRVGAERVLVFTARLRHL